MSDFAERFASLQEPAPVTLQALFVLPVAFNQQMVSDITRSYAEELGEAEVEWYAVADNPELTALVSSSGPAVTDMGLIRWSQHQVKVVYCAGPMPYGPLRSCVEPALLSPEDKQLASEHQAHLLLYEYSSTDPMDRHVAVAAIAGVFACLGAITILNEEARTAIPGPDLIPEEGEAIFQTLRNLPIPYLFGGFVRLDLSEDSGQWVRSFANHRLGLPELAMFVRTPEETRTAFQLFAGILGYARTFQEELIAGDTADLGEHGKVQFREPREHEWHLESEGSLLVLERVGDIG